MNALKVSFKSEFCDLKKKD